MNKYIVISKIFILSLLLIIFFVFDKHSYINCDDLFTNTSQKHFIYNELCYGLAQELKYNPYFNDLFFINMKVPMTNNKFYALRHIYYVKYIQNDAENFVKEFLPNYINVQDWYMIIKNKDGDKVYLEILQKLYDYTDHKIKIYNLNVKNDLDIQKIKDFNMNNLFLMKPDLKINFIKQIINEIDWDLYIQTWDYMSENLKYLNHYYEITLSQNFFIVFSKKYLMKILICLSILYEPLNQVFFEPFEPAFILCEPKINRFIALCNDTYNSDFFITTIIFIRNSICILFLTSLGLYIIPEMILFKIPVISIIVVTKYLNKINIELQMSQEEMYDFYVFLSKFIVEKNHPLLILLQYFFD